MPRVDAAATGGAPLSIGAVLLTAGSAARMGHRPKALLQRDGVPLVQRQLAALLSAGVQPVVVVLGHHAEHIEPLLRDAPVKRIHHPDPDQGQTSSLRLGLAALEGPVDAVMVALADQPLIDAQDIRDLILAYLARPPHTQVVQPSVDGLPGNPVVFSEAVRQAILASDPSVGCRQWQAAHPDQVHRWPSANARYRIDVDTPDDIQALAERTGIVLSWPGLHD